MEARRIHSVILDIVFPAVDAVRDLGQQLAPERRGAVLDDGVEGGLQHVCAVALRQCDHPTRTQPCRPDLGVDIAFQMVGEAGVAPDDGVGRPG